MSDPAYPKLRPLQPVPVVHMGQQSFFLRDPLELNGHSVLLPGPLAPLLALCDGTRDPDTIAAIFQAHFGLKMMTAEISSIIEALDQCYLLDNQRARALQDESLAAYRAAPHRPPSSAGGSYPAEPGPLTRMLNDYLEGAAVEPAPFPGKGLLSPHIDYARGGEIYAQVWKRATEMVAAADLFIVIGTDHYGGHNPITLTRQHYATPYGVLPTDQGLVDILATAIGEESAFAGELYHRGEHSLELPLVWLHHLTRHRPIAVVPILCGAFEPGDPRIEGLLDALQEAVEGRETFYVISGDLAHVGPAFGGTPMAGAAKRRVQRSDSDLLGSLEVGDADGFLAAIDDCLDENNVCGTYPLYLGMKAMGPVSGQQAGYAQCPADDRGTSIVSVAGQIFF